MGLGRRLVGDTIVYGVAFALARALSFSLLPILTRAFSPEEFGAYDVSLTFSRAMLLLIALGMETGIALMLQGRDERGQRSAVASYLLLQVIWGALLTTVAVAAAPSLSAILFGGDGRADLIAMGAGLAFAQALMLAIVSVAKWMRRPGAYLVLSVGSVGAASVVAAGAAISGRWGAEGAFAGMLLGTVAFTPVAAFICRGYVSSAISRADMIACFRFGLPFAAIVASDYVLFPILVRAMLVGSTGLAGVGLFGAASTVCLAILMLNEGFASAWWPYAMSEEGAPRIREDTRRVIHIYAFLLMLPVGVMTLLAEPLTRVVLGGAGFDAAAGLIGPIAFAYWIKSVRLNASVALVVSGRIWIRATLNFAAFAASLAFAYALTPVWGVAGAAWGFAAGEALGMLIQTVALRRFWDDRLDLRSLALMAAMFLALIWLAHAAAPAEAWALVIARCGIGAGFFGLLLATVPLAETRKAFAALSRLAAGMVRR